MARLREEDDWMGWRGQQSRHFRLWSGARILDDQLAQHHVRWGNERSSSTVNDDEALDVFFAFSGVEARDGPGHERLKLGGEMQALAGVLQPWIMARKTTRLILLERPCSDVTPNVGEVNE